MFDYKQRPFTKKGMENYDKIFGKKKKKENKSENKKVSRTEEKK